MQFLLVHVVVVVVVVISLLFCVCLTDQFGFHVLIFFCVCCEHKHTCVCWSICTKIIIKLVSVLSLLMTGNIWILASLKVFDLIFPPSAASLKKVLMSPQLSLLHMVHLIQSSQLLLFPLLP